MRFFLDTEWADSAGTQLVSLALLSEDGVHRFYSEISPLPANPTDFVRHVVYPLLEHGYAARQKLDFTRDLRKFLLGFPAARVIFDSPNDERLLQFALNGFDMPSSAIDLLPPTPLVTLTLIGELANTELYFAQHPELEKRRHHAMVDAEALRWSFISIRKY